MDHTTCIRLPLIVVLLAGLGLSGCAELPPESGGSRFALRVEKAEEPLVRTELGVALSGGGLRSALFNWGMLKWLYDQQVLDQVDIISSVSGGGYTAYWLYANHAASTNEPRFGFSSFDQSSFGRQACSMLVTSNFVTLPDVARAAVSPTLSSASMYEQELRDTFGARDTDPPLQVPGLQNLLTGKPRAPYHIINATLVSPAPQKGWADGRIEFTSLLKGNEQAGYTEWKESEKLPLVKAIAVSGAAVRGVLKQELALPLPGNPSPAVVADDGGKSENLGALALIRRGVKHVIIGDAEHDPRYVFGAYRNLKKRLEAWELDLQVDSIDTYLQSGSGFPREALHTGVVLDKATGRKVSTIYYLKMGRPESVMTMLRDQGARERGNKVNDEFYQRLKETRVPTGNALQPYRWRCDQSIEVGAEPMQDWFKFNMSWFMDSADASWRLKLLRWLPVDALHADYPQYSTIDQNFNLTQAVAYIGLGYFEAEELRSHLPSIRQP